ncbi:MAG: LCP family protein [Actinomycetes bacterium]
MLLLVGLVALVAAFGASAFRSYRSIERVAVGDVLSPVTGPTTNYLLVGSDARDGLDPDVGVGAPPSVTGKRSDTLIVLRVAPTGTSMMSIPRDLVMVDASTGRRGRVNGAYNGGPANLIRTVQRNLQLPIHHYMEVGCGSFAGVVDAVGGVTVNVPHPAFDRRSGLRIDRAGDVVLDGRQALAYVRSRHYTEVIDGRERVDPTADLGRQQRQQQFLRTALGEVGGERNPVALLGALSALADGVVIDDRVSMLGVLGLARKLSGTEPTTVVLPTRPARLGGAQVLVLDHPAADQRLSAFR